MNTKMENVFGGIFKGLTVLITGHTGFKGSWLITWLKALGATVIGYSRDSAIDPRNFLLCGLKDQIIHVSGDILDLDKLKETIEAHNPQLVLHLAAQPLVKIAFIEPKRTFDTNAGGTVNVLEAIRQTNSVRAFVGITTDKVYADRHEEDRRWVWGYRENDVLGGYDPYSASKAMAELVIQSYRHSWQEVGFANHSVAIASARGGNVIGGGDFSEYRLVPDCMSAFMKGETLRLNRPDAIRPWQHVLELLGGYLWLATKLLGMEKRLKDLKEGEHLRPEEEFREAWNFGPAEHESITCEAVVKRIKKRWAGGGEYQVPERRGDEPHETAMLRLNWVKAATRLAWVPTYNWEKSVDVTVDWYEEYHKQKELQKSGGPAVCMSKRTEEQIEDYVDTARAHGVKWANPS